MKIKQIDEKNKMDLIKHLTRHKEFSEKTFGPGNRTLGLCNHIAKELEEIKSSPFDLMEWIDVVILGFDGAWRAGFTPEEIAKALEVKQSINKEREWPDWRTAESGKPIEHIRTVKSEGKVNNGL